MMYKESPKMNTVPYDKSRGYISGSEFWYVGISLTRYELALSKARNVSHKIILIASFLLGGGFIGLFLFILAKRDLIEYSLTTQFWFSSGNSIQGVFWLGILCLLFAWSRAIESIKDQPYIEQKELDANIAPISISKQADIKALPKKQKVDIFSYFTPDAKDVVISAYMIADKANSNGVMPVHVFLALLDITSVSNMFTRLNISVPSLKKFLYKTLLTDRQAHSAPVITHEMYEVLFRSYEHAIENKEEVVDVTELVLATVLQSKSLQKILYDLEVDAQKMDNIVAWIRIRAKLRRQHSKERQGAAHVNKHGIDRAMTAVATPFLNTYSHDITLDAKYGRLEPFVAREKEIEDIFRVVNSGRQSILLVGERGTGKRSIVEGIAERMLRGEVPERLAEKRIIQLSIAELIAGTTLAGAQERLLRMLREIQRAGNIVLYIDSIHDIVASGEEGLDLSETLSDFLKNGNVLTFATTTKEAYQRQITNSAIGSALAKVEIEEMDDNATIQVLESKAGMIEYRQKVYISYPAIESAATFASKFLHEEYAPSGAISLITESASHAKSLRGANAMVQSEDVAEVLSDKTGIPATSISTDESEKLMQLESAMHERVVGQDEAVSLVANALRRARAAVRESNRPIANFLFLGPTGVGKTELAKTIADVYFGGEDRMIRIDMSEYQDSSAINRLIGQPNVQGTGILTEAVRQQPFSLVLLDEMEKADPNILNLFLQVFDDGRLTDSVGRVIDFTNTIIIATSNAGTSYVQSEIQKGTALDDIRTALIHGELKQYYRPEFLNRFDSVVLFRSLEREEIKLIASFMLKRVAKDLEERGIGFVVTDAALESLAEVGFDQEFGARPMRRAIQEHIENQIAEIILSKNIERSQTLIVGKGLVITKK